MTGNLARYHARAPRYILQPQDNTLIRVAGPQQIPWEEGTEIKNISLTGLAFTAPSDLCPTVGEIIKIEYEIPGQERMACYSLVTRLEPMGSSELLVGVKFYKMDMPQRIILAQGLALKIRDQQLKNLQENRKPNPLVQKIIPIFFFALWLISFYFMMNWEW
ncbi:MAG: hypothetical protein BroJett040_01850 [Oligoflexia bacterium]|nr:MAG: hypothetical protein BroJett040_01850 [Oligoflexia bacterium]